MTRLHQIQIQYHPAEDRAILRVNTTDEAEFRFWLTRRFVALLWPLLLRALDAGGLAGTRTQATGRAAVRAFEHEKALGDSNFATPFQAGSVTPLGSDPLLVARATLQPGPTPDVRLLSLQPLDGRGIELSLDVTMLHSIGRLIEDVVKRADWNLALEPLAPRDAPAAAGTPVN